MEADFMVRSHPAWTREAAVSAQLTAEFARIVDEAACIRMRTDRFHAEGVRVGDTGYIVAFYDDGRSKIAFAGAQGVEHDYVVAQGDDWEVCSPHLHADEQ
jgi:hypothetical protein